MANFFPSTQPQQVPDSVTPLLLEYEDVFREHKTLPPHRIYDHHIKLKDNTQAVNARLYTYPYAQKNEIEKMVKEMLDNGIIRPSNSAFASPVVLVKMKDELWHFCNDYRALNSLTIKDKFPIPVIEEL